MKSLNINWKTGVFTAVILTAAVFFLVRHFTTGEEAAIRRKLSALEDNISRSPGDGNITLSLKNQRLTPLFANPCRIKIPKYNVDMETTPREIAAQVFRLHSRASRVDLRFYDISITLTGEKKAEIIATVNVQGRAPEGGRFSETEEAFIEVVKEEDEWKFASFEQIEILER